jgi:FkbM family methyltransferase
MASDFCWWIPMTPVTTNLKSVNGWAVLPSSLKRPDGRPRFTVNFPGFFASDAGAEHLVASELRNGYEPPTRNLIERVLRRGDLFIDVGAHWGYFSLQAATHPAGDVCVISFEPELMNAMVLTENITRNRLTDVATVVCAACGNEFDLAPLVMNSTMGHSIRGVGLGPNAMRGPSKWVPVVSLDAALRRVETRVGRRVVLKIDAEGLEAEIIAGAKELLQSGRVALIIWECGTALLGGAKKSEMIEMIAFLSNCGFEHWQPPGSETDGPLRRFELEAAHLGNVFSLASQSLNHVI